MTDQFQTQERGKRKSQKIAFGCLGFALFTIILGFIQIYLGWGTYHPILFFRNETAFFGGCCILFSGMFSAFLAVVAGSCPQRISGLLLIMITISLLLNLYMYDYMN